MERLYPLNDFLFQKIFGEKGGEGVLLSLLNAILKRDGDNALQRIEILENKKITAEFIRSKESILDLRAVTQDNTRINIEIQLRNYKDMHMRTLFYWSKEFSKGIEAGQDYIDLPKVIVINIVDFNMIASSPNFHNRFRLWEDTEKSCLLTDKLEVHFIELPKFRKFAKNNRDLKGNALHRWLTFFDMRAEEQLINEVIRMDKSIEETHERIEHLAQDEETRRLYYVRDRILSDQASFYNSAKREGLEQGIEQGIKKRNMELIYEMLEKNISESLILSLAKISLEELEIIKKEKENIHKQDEIN